MTTIIKAGHPQNGSLNIRAPVFNLTDISEQADHYLVEVRQQAKQIVAEANQQAEAIRQRAEEEGRRTAFEAIEQMLQEKVTKQVKTALPALRRAVEELQKAQQSWISYWEKEAVHLATAIAERVIRRELSANNGITLDLISETLRMVTQNSTIKLNLNPEDYDTLREQVEKLVGELCDVATIAIISNTEITPGSCRLDTELGSIDQQIESQLRRIEEELTDF